MNNTSGLAETLGLMFLFGTLLFPSPSHSASSVEFHGTLIAGSCSPEAVDVDFSEVKLSDIPASNTQPALSAGNGAMKRFSLNINCTDGLTGEVQYRFKGNTSSFNQQAFETDIDGLGVMIADMQGTPSNIEPDVWYTLSNSSEIHELATFLIRDPVATISGGDFISTATVEVQIP